MPNPYANAKLYVDPTNSAAQHADSIRTDNPTRAEVFDKIGDNPVSMWAGAWITAGTEATWVDERMDKADLDGALATFVIYALPNVDGAGGGVADYPAYTTWIQNFITGFGGRHAVVIYEPDAVALLDNYTGTARTDREAAMKKAISDLSTAGLTVYVDGGHDNWHSATETANRLLAVGVSAARGIALNVSNFRYTSGLETYGADVIAATALTLTMVIDTSRNGNGPAPDADPYNPPGRALGFKPTGSSSNAQVDAYIWIKAPGESDMDDGSYQTYEGEAGDSTNGTIAPPPGGFWPNYAYGLANRAPWSESTSTATSKADSVSLTTWEGDTLFSKATGVTVSGADLIIEASSTYPSVRTVSAYDLKDSHFGSTIISPPNVGNGSVETHLHVEADTNNLVIFGWRNGVLRAESKAAGTSTYTEGPAYDPTNHKYIRLREAAGTLYYEASPDGTTWTNVIPAITTPFTVTSVYLSIFAGNWNAEPTPGAATWGAVNAYAGTSTVISVAASPASITGLTAGKQYEARVRATNSAGASAYSAWVQFTTNSTATGNTTADFTKTHPGSELNSLSFGSCISTYSGDGENVNIIKGTAEESGAWKTKLGEVGSVAWRIPLAWNGGTPGSSAGGARSYGDAGAYVQAIKDIGGVPFVAVGGTSGDNDILAADAAALVRYFNDNGGQNGGPVTHWIIGNEPDNDGTGIAGYINGTTDVNGVVTGSGFNAVVDAMRAATTLTLTIAGPALVTYADYKEAAYNEFFTACGERVDVIDFHMYDGATPTRYSDAMAWFNRRISEVPSMAGRVKVHCGEYNWHPFYDAASTTHNGNHFWTSRNTVAGALAIGRVANGGGRSYQYSDNNGPLGMITPGNGLNGAPLGYRIPTPSYFGVKMWTGGNLFRRPSGSMASCTTTLTGVEVFASAGNRNVVVVNKNESTSQAVKLDVPGAPASTTYEVWQTTAGLDPADPLGPQWQDPVRVLSGTYTNNRIEFTAPALTVTTILVGV